MPTIWEAGWKTGKEPSGEHRLEADRGRSGVWDREWGICERPCMCEQNEKGVTTEMSGWTHVRKMELNTSVSVYVPTRHFATAPAPSHMRVCLLGGGWITDLMISHGTVAKANTIKLLPAYIIDKLSVPPRCSPFKLAPTLFHAASSWIWIQHTERRLLYWHNGDT